MPPTPSAGAVKNVVRRALRRGVPPADAEDLAAGAWERAAARFDPTRGAFDAFFERVGTTAIEDWWRRTRRRAEVGLAQDPLAPTPSDRLEEVCSNQQRLLDALTEAERRVFLTWAAQKHLPQGTLTAPEAARRLGMGVAEFNNAKRRLATRIRALADDWGLSPRDFFSVDEHEGPRRRTHGHG